MEYFSKLSPASTYMVRAKAPASQASRNSASMMKISFVTAIAARPPQNGRYPYFSMILGGAKTSLEAGASSMVGVRGRWWWCGGGGWG